MDSQPRFPPPLPGTPDAPCFDGRNISDFLRQYNVMCRNYLLSDEERITLLPDYCTDQHHDIVRCLTSEVEMEGSGWEALVPQLKKIYYTEDYQEQTFSREFLEAYKSIRCDIEHLRFNSLMFKVISDDLIKRGLLCRDTQCQWFLEWLPNDEIVEECLKQVEFDVYGELDVDLDTLRTHALKAAEAQRYMKRLVQRRRAPDNAMETLRRIESLRPPGERSFVSLDKSPVRTEEPPPPREENSAIKEGFEALSERLQAVESELSALMDQRREESSPPILTPPSAPTDPRADSLSKTSNEQIPDPSPKPPQQSQQEPEGQQQEEPRDQRQEQLQDQQDQQDDSQQEDFQPEQQRQEPPPAKTPLSLPILSPPEQDRPIGKFPFNKCLYCYGQNHHRYNCPDFKDAEARGLVHVNLRNKLSLGPSGNNGPDIPLLPGRSQKQIVNEILGKREKAQGLPKKQGTMQVRLRSSASSSWRNESEHQSEQKITLSPEVQTKDELKHESDSEDENDAEHGAQPDENDANTAGTESSNPKYNKPKPKTKPAAAVTVPGPASDTDSDLPSLAPCSDSSNHSRKPSNDNSNSENENQNEIENEIENLEGLRSAEEAIQLMRTMETIGVEEFSERSKQRQGGPPPTTQSQSLSRSHSQGPSSEASTSGEKKKKKSGKSKKRRDQIQETVVNNGDEGIEPHIEL